MPTNKKRKWNKSCVRRGNETPKILVTLEDYVGSWQLSLESKYLKMGKGSIIKEIQKGTEQALKKFDIKRDTKRLNTAFASTIKKDGKSTFKNYINKLGQIYK